MYRRTSRANSVTQRDCYSRCSSFLAISLLCGLAHVLAITKARLRLGCAHLNIIIRLDFHFLGRSRRIDLHGFAFLRLFHLLLFCIRLGLDGGGLLFLLVGFNLSWVFSAASFVLLLGFVSSLLSNLFGLPPFFAEPFAWVFFFGFASYFSSASSSSDSSSEYSSAISNFFFDL